MDVPFLPREFLSSLNIGAAVQFAKMMALCGDIARKAMEFGEHEPLIPPSNSNGGIAVYNLRAGITRVMGQLKAGMVILVNVMAVLMLLQLLSAALPILLQRELVIDASLAQSRNKSDPHFFVGFSVVPNVITISARRQIDAQNAAW